MSWLYTECDGRGFYQCDALNNSRVTQAFSTRNAGNMALHTGDDPEIVVQNRHAFLKCIGLKLENLAAGVQTHGVNVQIVDQTMVGRDNGGFICSHAFPDTDALMTCIPGVILAVFTADCLPIFIYDPTTPVIAVIHAGWRGTLAGIAQLALRKMNEAFGTKASDCLAALGPGIRPECFRVDPELATRFAQTGDDVIKFDKSGYTVDLYRYNRNKLMEGGIPESRIDDGNLCTVCHPETFFSYRASRGTNGRMMGVITLNTVVSID